jgi:penicillin G amidase
VRNASGKLQQSVVHVLVVVTTSVQGCARISVDRFGTPGIWACGPADAYWGVGWLHGRYRPLQTLLHTTAARAELARRLLPLSSLVDLDALVNRLDLPRLAQAETKRLDENTSALLGAYVDGVAAGLRTGGTPWELRTLLARLPSPNREDILSGLLLAAYLGQAAGQERMEMALVAAVQAHAKPDVLAQMFAPHLANWTPAALMNVALPSAADAPWLGLFNSGGSNAWAVTGERTRSGAPILCGDPHLQINQLPSLLFEVRARVGTDWWLGATIPGLPGLLVGRNRRLAWSGTFSVADNTDLFPIAAATFDRGTRRVEQIERRWRGRVRREFVDTEAGVVCSSHQGDRQPLAMRWAGRGRVAEAIAAYLCLPSCEDAAAAEKCLQAAGTFGLHYVLADRGGDVRTHQSGQVPRRSGGWSGLAPATANADWLGMRGGAELPASAAVDGIAASANEARTASDGTCLATLAQPEYRVCRIREQLAARYDHDVTTMAALQSDVYSPQAEKLLPILLALVPKDRWRSLLRTWDRRCDLSSQGATAFHHLYEQAVLACADLLGGDWFQYAWAHSELPLWWCAAMDRLLARPDTWTVERVRRVQTALASASDELPPPWGEVRRCRLAHVLLSGLPRCVGLDRGPLPVAGSIATICQGTFFRRERAPLWIAPAYRMIADLAVDGLLTSLPGGIGGGPYSGSYDRWLDDWQSGRYHAVDPPDPGESDDPLWNTR